MAKVTVTNNTNYRLGLPRPLSGNLEPYDQRVFYLAVSEMEASPSFVKAVHDGVLSITVEEDPAVPDALEGASLQTVATSSGAIVWDQATTWAEVWQRILDAGSGAIVLVVGTETGDPLLLTPGHTYDLSGVYFLGVPGVSGQARVAFQDGVVLAVGALLRSKDVFWTWDAAMTAPIPAYSMSLELDGGAITAPAGAASYLFQTSNYGINTVKMVNGAVIDGSALTAPLAVFHAHYAAIVPPRPIGGLELLRRRPGPLPPRPWPPFPPPPHPPRHGIDFTLLESQILGSVVNTPSGSTNNTITADADSAFNLVTNFSGGAGVSVTLLYPPRMTTADRTAYNPPAGAVVYDTDVDAPFVMTGGGWRQLALV